MVDAQVFAQDLVAAVHAEIHVPDAIQVAKEPAEVHVQTPVNQHVK